MSKNLFLCNKSDLIEFKLPAVLTSFFDEGELISDSSMLNKVDEKTLKECNTIFIFAELTWQYFSPNKRLFFNGYKLAEELRFEKNIRARFVFISKMKLSFFIEAKKSDYQILFAPGSDFVTLEDIKSKEILEKKMGFERISLINLFRIKSSYCNLEGKLNTKIHSIKSEIDGLLRSGTAFSQIETFAKDEISYLAKWYADNSNVKEILLNFANKISFNTRLDIERFGIERFSLIRQQEESIPLSFFDNFQSKPWKILILDDKPERFSFGFLDDKEKILDKSLREILKVNEVIICRTVAEAKKTILFDEALFNEIAIIICDLELEKDNQLAQEEQGEDFIQWLETRPHTHHTFLISHLNRELIRKEIREFKLQCNDYYKSELKGSTKELKRFIIDIYDKGDDKWEILMNRPKAKRWTKITKGLPLKYGYKTLRNHSDYRYLESFITDEANKAITSFKETGKMKELGFKMVEYNYKNHGLHGLCLSLVARRVIIWLHQVKNIKDKIKIGKIVKPSTFNKIEKLRALRKNIKITSPESNFTKLQNEVVLVGENLKKIGRALKQPIKVNQSYNTEKVIEWVNLYNIYDYKYKIKRNKNYVTKTDDKFQLIEREDGKCIIQSISNYEQAQQDNSKKQLFSFLALILEDLPFGLLVEERNWLINHTGWQLLFKDDMMQNLQEEIRTCMNDLIQSEAYQEKIEHHALSI